MRLIKPPSITKDTVKVVTWVAKSSSMPSLEIPCSKQSCFQNSIPIWFPHCPTCSVMISRGISFASSSSSPITFIYPLCFWVPRVSKLCLCSVCVGGGTTLVLEIKRKRVEKVKAGKRSIDPRLVSGWGYHAHQMIFFLKGRYNILALKFIYIQDGTSFDLKKKRHHRYIISPFETWLPMY